MEASRQGVGCELFSGRLGAMAPGRNKGTAGAETSSQAHSLSLVSHPGLSFLHPLTSFLCLFWPILQLRPLRRPPHQPQSLPL